MEEHEKKQFEQIIQKKAEQLEKKIAFLIQREKAMLRVLLGLNEKIIMEKKGTRDVIGKTTHVSVQWEGSEGTMEFWESYPSFSPGGVRPFKANHDLSSQEVERAIAEWEKGGGLSL